MAPALSLPELHGLHARALGNAASARRDFARGGTIWHTRETALRTAINMLDAARNVRRIIENRSAK